MIQLDEIGVIYAPTIDETTAPEALPGWHVNATHPVPGWDAWKVQPVTPSRVFGGIPTVFYVFPSQPTYATALENADLVLPPPATANEPTLAELKNQMLELLARIERMESR